MIDMKRRSVSLPRETYDCAIQRAREEGIPLSQAVTQMLRRWLSNEITLEPAVESCVLGYETSRNRGSSVAPPNPEPRFRSRARTKKSTEPLVVGDHPERPRSLARIVSDKTPGLCALCANQSVDVVREPLGKAGALVNVCYECRTEPAKFKHGPIIGYEPTGSLPSVGEVDRAARKAYGDRYARETAAYRSVCITPASEGPAANRRRR